MKDNGLKFCVTATQLRRSNFRTCISTFVGGIKTISLTAVGYNDMKPKFPNYMHAYQSLRPAATAASAWSKQIQHPGFSSRAHIMQDPGCVPMSNKLHHAIYVATRSELVLRQEISPLLPKQPV
jgi:hypothetical protein